MEPIKVNDKTHEMLVAIAQTRQQLEAQIQTIRMVAGVPKEWNVYNPELKQFEPPKEK